METNRRNQTITRYRPPGVIPLELWDLLVDGRVLWEQMSNGAFPDLLRRMLHLLRRGQGETRSSGRVPEIIAGFDSLFLAGGRAGEPSVRVAAESLGMPTIISPTPDYPGKSEGHRILGELAVTGGWLSDLGQTSFKICTLAEQRQYPRDFERLPVRTDGFAGPVHEQRRQLRSWVAASLRSFLDAAEPPEALLFALPSRLDDQGVPEGSSYIGMAGDSGLINDVMQEAALSPQRVLVLNDAELAALDAVAEPRLANCEKTLVLTLGFGVGAALVVRARP